MKRCLFVVLSISLLACATLSFSQIQITQSSYIHAGQEFGFHSAENEQTVNLGSSGANQTWDFTGFTLDIEGSFAAVLPAATPYAGTFPTANLCCYTTTEGVEEASYSYQRVASDGAYYLGMVISGAEIVTDLEGEVRQTPFPLTYSSPNWTYVSSYTIEIMPGIEISVIDSVINDVDAWGTVNTPYGSYQSLRYFEHRWETSIIPPLPPNTTETVGYVWLTEQGAGAVSITGSAGVVSPNFTEGHVAMISSTVNADPPRGPIAENFSVGQNYPNPFNPTTSLPITLNQTASLEIKIYNELGELVSSETQTFGPGSHTIGFDGSAWASGSYFAQVKNGSQQVTKKMQLVK